MGRRALRTGDLVVPATLSADLYLYASATDSHIVGTFCFGLLLGKLNHPSWGAAGTVTSACVLDSLTMKYGWVLLKHLKRA